jgi:hypothetical protein
MFPAFWHTRVKFNGRWREISLEIRSYNEARKNRPSKVQEFEEQQKLPDLATLTFESAADLWLGERLKLVAKGTYKIEKQRLAPLMRRLGRLRLMDMTRNTLGFISWSESSRFHREHATWN